MYTVKKISKKPFFNANRLNGNSAHNMAGYGVYKNDELVGKFTATARRDTKFTALTLKQEWS